MSLSRKIHIYGMQVSMFIMQNLIHIFSMPSGCARHRLAAHSLATPPCARPFPLCQRGASLCGNQCILICQKRPKIAAIGNYVLSWRRLATMPQTKWRQLAQTERPKKGAKGGGEGVSSAAAADTAAACSNNSNDNHNKKQERMKLVQPELWNWLWLRPEARRT